MKDRIPFVLLILFSIGFIFSFYSKVIFHPDHYFFSNEGDAIKNYFSYAYHIKYDSSYINFEGMNYPYSEHFLFTDCHPVLADFLKLSALKSEFFGTQSIAIVSVKINADCVTSNIRKDL